MFSNETINCARIALRDAINEVREFDNLHVEDIKMLMVKILMAPKSLDTIGEHDIALFERIRDFY